MYVFKDRFPEYDRYFEFWSSLLWLQECFQSLLALLQWSWNTFKAGLNDISHISSSTSGHLAALLDLERLVYISQASLRLLRTYTNEIYPNNGENSVFVVCFVFTLHLFPWYNNLLLIEDKCVFRKNFHLGLLCFWTSSFVWYSKKHKRIQRFGNWICFCPGVRVGRHLLCWVH
jgi:hypothetical protein